MKMTKDSLTRDDEMQDVIDELYRIQSDLINLSIVLNDPHSISLSHSARIRERIRAKIKEKMHH
jgi:Ni,Fe-hydrogenase III large subunit